MGLLTASRTKGLGHIWGRNRPADCHFLYVNTSMQLIAYIVPIARNPFSLLPKAGLPLPDAARPAWIARDVDSAKSLLD